MKKIYTIIFAVLMVSAMGLAYSGDAWAKDDGNTTTTEGSASSKNSGSSSSSSGSFHFNGANFMNNLNNGSGNFMQNLLGGVVGSVSAGGSASAGGYVHNASGSGSVTSVNNGGGMGIGGYVGMAGGSAANLGSAIWGTVTSKLLDLFGNVKTVLYILAAFGLIGFAFAALFGKVRWGWVCALAFGLAAVAAAGQIIDYVSQAGVGGAMYDTLGSNMY